MTLSRNHSDQDYSSEEYSSGKSFEVETPIGYDTLIRLDNALRHRTPFHSVGELLLKYDSVHRVLTVRDGFGAPVRTFRLWKHMETETTPAYLHIYSGEDVVSIPWLH